VAKRSLLRSVFLIADHMRIGLDGIPLTELKTGVGIYTFELACALATGAPQDNFELISPSPYSTIVVGESKPANLRLVYSKSNALTHHWWAIGLPAYIGRNSLALFHGTNYEVSLRDKCPTVLTIHDLSSLLHSNTHVPRAVWRSRLRLPLMARKATLIVTPSQLVRSEVCEHLKTKADKVVAVPLAPRRCFTPLPSSVTLETRRRLGIEDEFLLFVGTIEPRKNLLTLIRAFEEILRTTDLRPQLVIVGKTGWKTDELFTYLEKSWTRDRVLLTGYLSDEDLCALYSSCRAFIYPSIYEGFGLPPLEAMSCGAAVIASPVPSITESAGRVARLVSPEDVHALAESMVELLTDTGARESLSIAGSRHAANFSWERTAASTREVYTEAFRRRAAQRV
jgi:glycosyltransferase involved in cell wall biosynthesis